jgi:2-keto-4-pentenoate hydratase/2-oxohepta-3-ene-1,7-dioic acid hydratase in catechol pathway
MRYAKLNTPDGPIYVEVVDRDGELWAAGPCLPPEEDPLPHLRAAVQFRPAPLAQFKLLPPVRPSKILCVGRNYRDHAAELGNEVPKAPLLFFKPMSSLLAPGGTIVMPKISTRVDFEGELALVMGRRCRNLGPDEDVRPYLRGYTLVNDVTARDIQKSDGNWTRGKGFDTFCPVGPLVSEDLDPIGGAPVTLTTRLNGEVRQTGSTADLIFPIPELLRYITSFLTLEPGDLIPTGTPAGVAAMKPGDVVEIAIDGLGILRNTVAPE